MRITSKQLRQNIREELERSGAVLVLETRDAKVQYAQTRDPSMDSLQVIHWVDAQPGYEETDVRALAKVTKLSLERIKSVASSGLEISANPVYPGAEQIPNLGSWGWLGLLISPRVVTYAGDMNVNTAHKKTPSGLRARVDEPGDERIGDYNVINHPDQIFGEEQKPDVEIVLVPKKILGLVFSPAMFDEYDDMMPYTVEEARAAAKKISKKTGLPLYDEFLMPIV